MVVAISGKKETSFTNYEIHEIILSQFFAEDKMIEVNDELKNLFDHWKYLTPTQKDAVFQIMKAMKNESNS